MTYAYGEGKLIKPFCQLPVNAGKVLRVLNL